MIQIYTELFKVGFDLNETSVIMNNRNKNYYVIDGLDFSTFSQLLPCVCQSGISSKLILYLVDLYEKQNGHEEVQYELARLSLQCLTIYNVQINLLEEPKLKAKEMIIILTTILPMLEESLMREIKNFIQIHRRGCFVRLYPMTFGYSHIFNLIGSDQQYNSNLFEREDFLILDLLISYKLMKPNFLMETIEFMMLLNLNENILDKIQIIRSISIYILENQLLKLGEVEEHIKKGIDTHFETRFSIKEFLPKKDMDLLMSSIKTTLDRYRHQPISLLNLSKSSVRKLYMFKANDFLNDLALPNLIKRYIQDLKSIQFE